jgi:hypothetical protein
MQRFNAGVRVFGFNFGKNLSKASRTIWEDDVSFLVKMSLSKLVQACGLCLMCGDVDADVRFI